MIKLEKKSPTNVVGHLNDVLRLDDPKAACSESASGFGAQWQHELAESFRRDAACAEKPFSPANMRAGDATCAVWNPHQDYRFAGGKARYYCRLSN